MGTEPLIRDATPEDLAALRDVYRLASLANEDDRPWLDEHPDVLEYAFVDGATTRVAELDGSIVGFATVIPPGELEDLFVRPGWMRRGIGRVLVEDAVRHADAPLEVTANLHALAFYEALGFVVENTVETAGGPAARMRLLRDARGA